MNWQPIETAPRDGRYILVWGGGHFVVFWNGRHWDDGEFSSSIDDLSHWMPLPEPPQP